MMNIVSQAWQSLKKDFWGTFAEWQDRRTIWIVGGMVALLLDVIAWAFFQNYLKLTACEMCVYIRFSMFVIFFAALIAAINPKNVVLKLVGYIAVIWAIVRGVLWSDRLIKMHERAEAVRNGADFFSFQGLGSCTFEPEFPFGLPLHQWLPSIFAPNGLCGEDDWAFLTLSMGEWMLVIYACFSVLLMCMIIGGLVRFWRKSRA